MIWSQLKTAAQMASALVRKGYLATWYEKDTDGTILHKYKDDSGSIGLISGGGGTSPVAGAGRFYIPIPTDSSGTATVAGTCTVTSDGTYRVQGEDTFYVLNLNPPSKDLTLESNETKTIELTSVPVGSYLAQGTGSFFLYVSVDGVRVARQYGTCGWSRAVYKGPLQVQVTGGILEASVLRATINSTTGNVPLQTEVTWSGSTKYGAYTYDFDLQYTEGRWQLDVVLKEIVGGDGDIYRGNHYYNSSPTPWSGTWTNTSGTGDTPTVSME
mgnify:CR=1 FL=1